MHRSNKMTSIASLNREGLSFSLSLDRSIGQTVRDKISSYVRYENFTGIDLYAKTPNGLIEKVPSRQRVNNSAKSMFIYEYVNWTQRLSELTDKTAASYDKKTTYDFSRFEYLCEKKINEHEIVRQITPNYFREAENNGGYFNRDTGVMFFTSLEEAERTPHVYNRESTREWTWEMGYELVVYDPANKWKDLYIHDRDTAQKVRKSNLPANDGHEVVITHYNENTEQKIIHEVSVESLLEGEGFNGFRLYQSRAEAEADLRRPIHKELEKRIELEEAELSNCLEAIRETNRQAKEELMDAHNAELSNLKEEHRKELERLTAEHKAKLEELKVEEARSRKHHEEQKRLVVAEMEKARVDDRWRKASDRSGVVNRVVDIFQNMGKAFIGIFA